jgi:phosphoribosyl-ATP pyrophosphohydrolase/phosphoribosyl-AMP cyclohydrolase/histidinol dehydrogenase
VTLLPRRTAAELASRNSELPPDALRRAREIIDRVREGGEAALRLLTEEFGERRRQDPLVLDREALQDALGSLGREDRDRLERVAARIARFADAQRATLTDLTIPIPGGKAGHLAVPVECAGCYVPGGRHPLPSSALMTAIPARTAGVKTLWMATPRPHPLILAAAAIADVDGILIAGGAHAVAALALGAGPVPAVDVVVGPGNVHVTAAKQLLAGRVGIDMLAGPSELVVLADGCADPALVAADLLAQAEHDVLAVPVLVTTSHALARAVDEELERQLADLPTAETARVALTNGGAVLCPSLDAACHSIDLLAPEHLELLVEDPERWRTRIRHWGAAFLGPGAAEVLGDYGAGPNHTLPTSRAARFAGGLSVFTFLRIRSWMAIEDTVAASPLAEDAAWFARIEGLEGHARAALRRIPAPTGSVGESTPHRIPS